MQEYCQSCGMPMGGDASLFGNNADGSRNDDYCKYCYDSGSFTSECTMDEMIALCLPHLLAACPGMTDAQGVAMMRETFPQLKRWRVA